MEAVLVLMGLADYVQDGGIPAGRSGSIACSEILDLARVCRGAIDAGARQKHRMIHCTEPCEIVGARANSHRAQLDVSRFAEQTCDRANRKRGVAPGGKMPKR